jgi:hypothetical protein
MPPAPTVDVIVPTFKLRAAEKKEFNLFGTRFNWIELNCTEGVFTVVTMEDCENEPFYESMKKMPGETIVPQQLRWADGKDYGHFLFNWRWIQRQAGAQSRCLSIE